MSDFVMPSLGADMEKGTVVEWRIKPGSAVKRGDVVAVVETLKGAIEVEIFEEGTVAELIAKEGQEVPVGGVLARITRPGETAPAQPAPQPPLPATPQPKIPPPIISVTAPSARVKVSPAARRRAAERGIDPDRLTGTGIDGSVTLVDVEAAPAPTPADAALPKAAKPRRGFEPSEMRQAIAAAVSRSKREIPHYYLTTTIDMSAALQWLEAYNKERLPEERLLPAVLTLKATAKALRATPQLNGYWESGAFRAMERINIGWAVSLRGGGLIAPALRDVDRMTLPEVMAALRDLVARARGGGLRSSELTDPTFTVTSLGDRGAESVIGVIYPPQVAILGLGRISKRPWVVDNQVAARPLMAASLSADHRASDGHTGGLFLDALDRLLQEPDAL